MLMLSRVLPKENSVFVCIPQHKVKSPPAGIPVFEVEARDHETEASQGYIETQR